MVSCIHESCYALVAVSGVQTVALVVCLVDHRHVVVYDYRLALLALVEVEVELDLDEKDCQKAQVNSSLAKMHHWLGRLYLVIVIDGLVVDLVQVLHLSETRHY